MIVIEHDQDRSLIVIRASGTLSEKDYKHAIPKLNHAIELAGGPLRVVIRLEDFQGWELDALWKELQFDATHVGDFDRIAVIGESGLEKWATKLSAPFTKAEMRFFPTEHEDAAQHWLAEDDGASGVAS